MNREAVKAALTSLKQLMLGNSSKLDCARLTVALVFMLVGLVLGGIIGYGVFGRSKATDYVSERDTSTYIDTIPYYQPVPKDSMVIKYVTRTLPVKRRDSSTTNKTDTFLAENYAQNNGENIPPLYASVGFADPAHARQKESELSLLSLNRSGDSDSAAVAIPITQKRYDGDDYRAYVSGYEPNLDSIFVFPKTTVIHERSYKPPNKWHIGITGGYGYGFTSKQAEPFVGVGIMYSILSF